MKTTVPYFSSFTISLLGNGIANVVLPILVLVSTGEPVMAGAVALASGASTLIFGSIAGPLIDKYDRRIIAGVADLISASSIGLLAAVATFGELSPVWFIVCATLSGAGDLPAWNAREAMIYGVQRHSRTPFETLVGIRETLSALAIVMGPTMAGLLMNFLDARTVLWVTCATSLLAAVMIFLAPKAYARGEDATGAEKSARWKDSLVEGWKFLRASDNSALRTLTALNVASVALVSVLQALLIPVVMTINDAGEMSGYALAAIGFGLLLGGVVYAVAGTKIKPWPLLATSTVLNVVVFALLILFLSIPYTIALCFFFGLTAAAVGAVTGVVSINLTPENMRGRITSMQNSAAMVVGPVVIFGLAWLISFTSVTTTGVLVAVAWALANGSVLMSRSLRKEVEALPASSMTPAVAVPLEE